ncbi:hypothetical protein Daesc_008416 [Daldinia eschscholtzii]|uniref:RNase MRP protein 1 RNA binding domain-containing protein n=1 Tax=Daldinia eschscholtzii TaxID=292717 RepID=A0AAX6MBR3_9PEZI
MVPVPSTSAAGSLAPATITTSVNGNAYQDALDGLQPLLPVLRGFNHRNKNQHRRAAWWAAFGMLRRHVERLVDELLEAAAITAAASNKSKSKKRQRSDDGGGVERKVKGHVEWLRDVLVPKSDNQFATLGVVLLGVLAQVNTTCVRLVGEATVAAVAETSLGETGIATPHEPISSTTPATRITQPGTQGPKGPSCRLTMAEISIERGGSVIPRDEVARAEKLRRKNIQAGSSDLANTATIPEQDHGGDNDDDDDDDDAKTLKKQRTTTTSSKVKTKEKEGAKPAKKKKTKKGGDEFDDLFKNLF